MVVVVPLPFREKNRFWLTSRYVFFLNSKFVEEDLVPQDRII